MKDEELKKQGWRMKSEEEEPRSMSQTRVHQDSKIQIRDQKQRPNNEESRIRDQEWKTKTKSQGPRSISQKP